MTHATGHADHLPPYDEHVWLSGCA